MYQFHSVNEAAYIATNFRIVLLNTLRGKRNYTTIFAKSAVELVNDQLKCTILFYSNGTISQLLIQVKVIMTIEIFYASVINSLFL